MAMFHLSVTACFFFYYFYSSLHLCDGCFPPLYYESYSHYPMALSAGRARSYADTTDFNIVSDEHPSLLAASSVEENLGVVQESSDLNCHGFGSECRWSNTNEDELDWKVLVSTPEAEPWVSALHTTHLPDALAAVLLSSGRSARDAGRLVSDLLPCIVSPLRLTATVWRSSLGGPFEQQPNLQICSRNTNSDQLYSNCSPFPIQNGIPVTVNIPGPRDPTAPAQIILLGDNFVGKRGGAIFVEDIIVDGNLVPDCTIKTSFTTQRSNELRRQQSRRLLPSHNFKDSTDSLIEEVDNKRKISDLRQASALQLASPSLTDSLMIQCLKLSCSSVEKSCSWQKDVAGWMASTGTAGFSNLSTSIITPPVGIDSFLLASYSGNSKNSVRRIISPSISISSSERPIYFCFYEYFALKGAHFTMCTNELNKGCFYSRTDVSSDVHSQKGRRWNFRCAELPAGTYKIYVSSESNGPVQGDIGFVPLRLSRNRDGSDPVC
ncbi:unnamed protein product [Litomosoides sigmodontis]|uniref:MAM domain-containing protein n=1 Tax=Litomosoides sigmodontis TaxID=42156 RepID=A0A3P6VAQ8_LITSI|nr:unnamed protein product [Litomosoides sigmodontis]